MGMSKAAVTEAVHHARRILAAASLLAFAACGGTPSPTEPETTTGQWGTPEILEANVTSAAFPRVEVNPAGRGLAVWEVAGGIAARRFDAAGGGQALPLLPAADHQVTGLGLNPSGDALITWSERESARPRHVTLWARRGNLDAGFGPAERLDAGDPDADFANFSMDASLDPAGDAIAAWAAFPAFANRYETGRGWQGPHVLSARPTNAPRVATDAAGNGIVVWQETLRGAVARFFPGRGWTSEARGFDVAMDATGNAILVFGEWDGTRDVMRARRYAPGAGWGPPQQVDAGGQSISPALAVDASGNALLVWTELLPSNAKTVWANRFAIVTTR
jgi:hypothetical protein